MGSGESATRVTVLNRRRSSAVLGLPEPGFRPGSGGEKSRLIPPVIGTAVAFLGISESLQSTIDFNEVKIEMKIWRKMWLL
jgi:hypothetical protein